MLYKVISILFIMVFLGYACCQDLVEATERSYDPSSIDVQDNLYNWL